MQDRKFSSFIICAMALALSAALAGCEGTVSTELGTNAPADPTLSAVNVEIAGVEFRKDDGGTETLEFDSPTMVDLMEQLNGDGLRLFTDEELPDGRYTGVRLVFGDDEDENNGVTLNDGREFPLRLADSNEFSDVEFTVDKNDSSNDSIQLTVDLRQSLPFDDDDNDGPILTPLIRAVRAEDAGSIQGNVLVSCPANSLLAVYLFSGEDVTPDDRDGDTVDPYLTTAVGVDGSSTTSGYLFQFVPEGRYTLAATCRGDEENPSTNDDLDFERAVNTEVEAKTTVTQNLPN